MDTVTINKIALDRNCKTLSLLVRASMSILNQMLDNQGQGEYPVISDYDQEEIGRAINMLTNADKVISSFVSMTGNSNLKSPVGSI